MAMVLDVALTIGESTAIGIVIALAVQVAVLAIFSAIGGTPNPIRDFIGNALGPALQAISVVAAFVAVLAAVKDYFDADSLIGKIVIDAMIVIFPGLGWISMGVAELNVEPKIPKTKASAARAVVAAVFGLILTAFSLAIAFKVLDPGPYRFVAVLLLDVFGIYLALKAMEDSFKNPGPSALGTYAKGFAVASLFVAMASFTVDVISVQNEGEA